MPYYKNKIIEVLTRGGYEVPQEVNNDKVDDESE